MEVEGIVHQPLFEDLLVRARDAGITFCPSGESAAGIALESLPLGQLCRGQYPRREGWLGATRPRAPHDEIDTLLSGCRIYRALLYYSGIIAACLWRFSDETRHAEISRVLASGRLIVPHFLGHVILKTDSRLPG